MALSNNKDSFQQLITLFKEGYKSSSKTFVWVKALNEWKRLGGIGFTVLILCLIFLAVSKEFRQEAMVKDSAVSSIASKAYETMSFIDVGRRSLEKREELLKELMQAEENWADTSQDTKEKKLNFLSSLLENCREARRYFMNEFSKVKDPHLNSEIGEQFDTLIAAGEDSRIKEKPTLITFEEESTKWGNLLWLCENLFEKAQAESLSVAR
jgi:hypothetical protein